MTSKTKSAFADKKMIGRAIKESFIKLNPKTQVQNPVMLLVYLSAILTTVLWIVSLFGLKDASSGYTFSIAVILWFTCVFANFAEAIAEGRGKAQADALRASKKDVEAHKIPSADKKELITNVSSATLKKGDIVIVKAGEQIPGDGEVIEGAASVDESAITGESAPVIPALNWTPPPQSLVVASFNGIHICALCESFLTSSFYQVIFLFLPRSKPLLQG